MHDWGFDMEAIDRRVIRAQAVRPKPEPKDPPKVEEKR